MTGAELLVACLENAGIDTIYGLPGEENTDLMLAIKASSIRFVLTRHEQTAAFMASVHGRLTGRPAACLGTLGPGATNLLTGVADATLDLSPVLAITGQGSTDRLARSESHQVIDLTALFDPVTKLSRTLSDADEIPATVAEAVRLAMSPRAGAVHLSLPEDVAAQATSAKPLPQPALHVGPPAAEAVRSAARIISESSRPVIVAGAGVLRSGAAKDVARFAEAHTIALTTTFMGNGILPIDHDLALGTIGQPFDDYVNAAVRAADLVIAIGFDAVEVPPASFEGDALPKVVTIGEVAAAADVGWHLAADVAGDISAALAAVSDALDGQTWNVHDAARKAQTALRAERADVTLDPDLDAPKPEQVLRVVEDDLDEGDIVISGVGTHKLKLARSLAAKRPGQLIIANGLAGMGIALPGAMVAAEKNADGRTLAIVGDGEFLMNVQDMETAERLGSVLTVLLWEDGGYGLIEEKQESAAGEHSELRFNNPNWSDLCSAFGWSHIAVDTLGELGPALAESRRIKAPTLVTIKIDYSDGLGPNPKDGNAKE